MILTVCRMCIIGSENLNAESFAGVQLDIFVANTNEMWNIPQGNYSFKNALNILVFIPLIPSNTDNLAKQGWTVTKALKTSNITSEEFTNIK